MPDVVSLLAARIRLLATQALRWSSDRLTEVQRRHRAEPERGGPMTEYAILLGVAAAAIALIAAVIAFVRGKFAAFGGGT